MQTTINPKMKTVPMLDLRLEYEYMKKDIDAALSKCLEHQKWIFGPEVKELEGSVAAYLGTAQCIGVSSGTEALVLSLRAQALKKTGKEFFSADDEIITSPFTFTATGDAILRAGATPVFVDIDPSTYNMDVNKLRSYLASNSAKVVGIIPVHLYGQACDMENVMSMAKEHDLFVLEDVAQAFGGAWKGRKLGAIGAAGAFSFFPSKNLGGFGDGGMVSTNDEEIAGLVRMLLKHGGKDKYNVDHIGYNARLDTLQAAIVLAKSKYIDEFNKRRRSIADFYNKALSGLNGLSLPLPMPDADLDHVYHQYTIRMANGRRDDLQKFLNDNNISTMVYYPMPLHQMKVFQGRSIVSGYLPESEKAAKEVLSLPIEPLMTGEGMSDVVETIKGFFGRG
jgi:dTDP-4-amino-4,6-dideoxygalactose transaminase